MKNKVITLLIVIFFSNSIYAQSAVDKNINDVIQRSQKQLNTSLKTANTLIATGSVLAIGGAVVAVIGVDNYSRKSDLVNEDNGIINNQVGMNKTIPAAILGLSGVVVSGIGISVLTKGIIQRNNIKIELVKYSYTSALGLGVKMNF